MSRVWRYNKILQKGSSRVYLLLLVTALLVPVIIAAGSFGQQVMPRYGAKNHTDSATAQQSSPIESVPENVKTREPAESVPTNNPPPAEPSQNSIGEPATAAGSSQSTSVPSDSHSQNIQSSSKPKSQNKQKSTPTFLCLVGICL